MKNNMKHTETPVILLHGLGEHVWKMYPLKFYLSKVGGFTNIHIIHYRVNAVPFDEALALLDGQLEEQFDKDNDKLIVVGHSMGGIMANNLHKKGWSCLKIVTIGSPLHGARYLVFHASLLPTVLVNYVKKNRRCYDYLLKKAIKKIKGEKPPHDYHNITMSLPFTNFDGCVFVDEGKMDDENHTNFGWSYHDSIIFNPMIWSCVLNNISAPHS